MSVPVDPELGATIERLASELVDMLGKLDAAVTGDGASPAAPRLASAARRIAERLLAAAAQLGDDPDAQLVREKADNMAACAFELDRDINGGTLQ